MLIDFHVHAFPDDIAKRAIPQLSRVSGYLRHYHDGTIAGARELARRAGVAKNVLLHIATKPQQQRAVNEWAIATNTGDMVSFGTVHPDAPDALDELDFIKEAGLKGIKFHADYQDFFVDEPRMFPIYEKAARLGLITVFHGGVDNDAFEPVHCSPERLANALPAFCGGVVVSAHFGAYIMWNDVEKYLVGKDVYFDTSFCFGRLPRLHGRRIILSHGPERILFASDSPWSDPADEVKYIKSMDLGQDIEELIFHKNAERILGL